MVWRGIGFRSRHRSTSRARTLRSGRIIGLERYRVPLFFRDPDLRRPDCRNSDSRSMEGRDYRNRRPCRIACDHLHCRFIVLSAKPAHSWCGLESGRGGTIRFSLGHRRRIVSSGLCKKSCGIPSQFGRILFCGEPRDTSVPGTSLKRPRSRIRRIFYDQESLGSGTHFSLRVCSSRNSGRIRHLFWIPWASTIAVAKRPVLNLRSHAS